MSSQILAAFNGNLGAAIEYHYTMAKNFGTSTESKTYSVNTKTKK